ncbi:MAG: hypothetical protein RIG62_22180 [Cyclobacteriaceae bacterium]
MSFRPTIKAFELKTLLIIRNYGNYLEDELVEVEIVGDLLSRSGQNYKSQTKDNNNSFGKIPFKSYAEYFKINEEHLSIGLSP